MILTDPSMAFHGTSMNAGAIPFHRGGMRGLADASDGTGIDSSFLTTVTGDLKDLVTAYNQQQILNANIERAKQGLPPINTASIAPTYNVGLSPDIKNMLLFGGLALLAILFLKRGR